MNAKKINAFADTVGMGPNSATSNQAYRINLADLQSQWVAEDMPGGAVMRDSSLMPDGQVCLPPF